MAFHHEARSGGGSVSSIMNNNSSERKFTKLFVGGLAWETKSESLHRYFEEFGDIEEAVVIYDRRTGRSKGYGFVTFKDQEAARRACANPNPVIDGREANCNIASLGRRPHQPLSPFGNMVPTTQGSPVISSPHAGGGPLYPLPLAYGYQPGYYYPSYRPMMYGPGYLYPQVYAPPSSKKMPDDPISPYGYASTGGYLLPSPNAIHSPGPSFGEPMQYSPGAFVPSLRQPPVLSMPPTGNHHQVNKESASDQVA